MKKITKKIVAILTTVTCAVWMMGPGTANALTAAELQTMINDLLAQIATLQSQLAAMEGGGTTTISGCTITSFDTNLKLGMSSDAVKCLQIVLNSDADTQLASSGVGSPGNETSYFGPLTQGAVIKFQEKYASEVLATYGLTSGTGFVGTTTRAKLNTLLGGIPAGCDCTSWISGACGTGVNAGKRQQTRTCSPAACALESQYVTDASCIAATTGPSTVSLAYDTPEAAQTALGAQDAIFTKIKFTGGDNGVTITKVIVTRSGVSADTDISSIKLYDGTTRIGSAQALNTNTHKATFSSLSWDVPAGETKYLTIKGSIAALGTATVGDSIKLGIASASDITSTAALSGTFPIYGNTKTVAGISVGGLEVDAQDVPATNANMLSGATDQEIASWKFTASSTEGVEVHSIKVTHTGSATRDDISNIKLKVSGVQIGETIAKFDSQNSATFDVAGDLNILSSGVKTVYAYCDVASGIWTSRTIIFEISQYTDLTAYGANSGGAIQASGPSWATFSRQYGKTMTIAQGALTVTVDSSLNPAAQNYVKGSENRLIAALKFTAGSQEGVRISELKLKLANSATQNTYSATTTATDISNITLWDGSTQIAGPASVIGSYVTFGSHTVGWDTTGLFDIGKSQSKTIQVKADIPTGAVAGHQLELYVAANTDVYADGLSSMYDLTTAPTVTGANYSYTNAHTITGKGALAVSKSSLTPAAQIYVVGSTEKVFAKINLTADSGENMLVSAVVVDCYQGAGSSACSATAGLSNMKILKSDGTQYGSTIASPTASSTFSGSLTVTASQTETLSVVADIPLTSYPSTAALAISGVNMTVTGASSAADITASSVGTGNNITIGGGELTISAAATPGDQNVIVGATEVPFIGLVMKAGTAEDVRVTYIKLHTSSTSTASGVGLASTTDVSNIALWDGSTRLTTKKDLSVGTFTAHTVSWSASDFLNSTGIDIAKGQQKIITVKADIPSTATAYHSIGFGIATTSATISAAIASTTDVAFVGLSSNTTPAALLTLNSNLPDGLNYDVPGGSSHINAVSILGQGTLTVTASADTPAKGMVAVGTYTQGASNVAFSKYDFTAAIEDIDITSVKITRFQGQNVDFVSLSLWDGATQLGTDQALSNGTTTFDLVPGEFWRIPAGETKTLTVKANLKGIETANNTGARTGDAPTLCIATDNANLEIGTLGVSSGETDIVQTGTAALCGNWQLVHRSKPTIAVASLPSTVYGAGTKTLFRWTVTADSQGAIGWAKMVFYVSGSIQIGSDTYTVGCGGGTSTECITTNTSTDGIYMGTSTTACAGNAVKLIATSTLKVYNVATGDQITATTSLAHAAVYNYPAGGARVLFVPASEEIIAAGTTKTYELRGDILYAGKSGDSLSVKIEDLSTATSTNNFTTIALNSSNTDISAAISAADTYASSTFVWNDRSGSGSTPATHGWNTTDWTNDYKVSGIPTQTLTLSK